VTWAKRRTLTNGIRKRLRSLAERFPLSVQLLTKHQVDHVIAEKHGGQTALDNLALSCTVRNRQKGSDISSID
jgi:5-methylcytosine-specific restriction endonuclease McrA